MMSEKQIKNNGRDQEPKDHLFKPGQSGNPKGRPKHEYCLTSLLRELLEGEPEMVKKRWLRKRKKLTAAQLLALKMVHQAVNGDVQVQKIIIERVDGKVVQPIGGPTDRDMTFRVEWVANAFNAGNNGHTD